ncbi:MAG: FAD/NAD(P)-binding protein, partial [Winogradskyella sp.]|uniref:FAD/NAD(P)-binding protein n=1 Tax=Winogradskyella sp. TaxID=1883156 RepID=UPI0018272DA1|nr:FAD/NAD(P)-binding protein [Winogradskyella sp.]
MTRLAIIGMGPRGLYALENLLIQLSANNLEIEIFIFESSDHPGSGNVWHQQQPESNWINITERELSGITARPGFTFANITFEAFPSYHDWCNFNLVPSENDKFPPRSKLGKYLHERFKAIAQNFKSSSLFNFIETDITEVDYQDNKIIIKSKANLWSFDDLLLTIGHQPTKLSDQIEQWKAHADRNENLKVFDSPYPVNTLSELRGCTELTIGIRGFGLAMIDVMRYLVINNYGNFKVINPSTLETVYYKTQPQHLKLIPFSLDGLPLAPKPLNEIIDTWYQPKGQELAYFKSSLETAAQESIAANSLDFLIAPIAKIASRVFNDLKEKSVSHSMNKDEIETQIKSWLKDENYKHVVFQDETIATYKLIQAYIDMALGNAKVSLDYCVWQVWRHCQPSLYEAFSHAQVKKQIIKKVIT